MNSGGIRQKLILLALLPALLFMLVMLAWSGWQSLSHANEALEERGEITARYLSSIAEFAVTTGNLWQLRDVAEGLLQDEILRLRVFDQDNQLVLDLGDDSLELSDRLDFPTEIHRCDELAKAWLFCAPVLYTPISYADIEPGQSLTSQLVGRIELAVAQERLHEQKRQVVANSLFGLLLTVMVLLFLIRRFEFQITQPLLELTRSVSLISDGATHVVIKDDASGELRILQQGFNKMARTLDKHRSEMERRIHDATEKLSAALAALEQRNCQLQEQTQKAQAASRAKSDFLATMSHEIRTPLSGIIGMLSLLEREALPKAQQSYLDHLEQAATSLRMLIEDVLDFSRIEAGKLELNLHECELSKNIESVALMLALSAQQKGLELLVDIDPRLPERILGDEVRFRQVLINLLGNAIKFTEQGHVLLHIQCEELSEDRVRVRVEVSDTGIGIPYEKQASIFDGFTQIDTSMTRRHGGSGLGTTISRELVALMGGEIGLNSVPGEGSCFWFELDAPVVAYAAKQRPLAGQRILAVERYPAAAQVLEDSLRALGAEVESCHDEACVALLPLQRYDLVLLCEDDVHFSWRELAHRLHNAQHELRLFHLTLIDGESEASTFTGHQTKPVTAARLLRMIEGEPRREPGVVEQSPAGCRILLAEDDRINATVASSFLRKLGHQVTLVVDGEAALQALAERDVDLAIVDLRMPLLDGLAVSRRWRQYERSSGGHLPIIALTANASEEDRQACMAAGMDDFLTKPVSLAKLSEVIGKFL